jgi:hypothetical protein
MVETSGSGTVGDKGTDGRSPLRWAALGALVLIAVVAIFVWQQSGGGGGSLNAVAEAAVKTEHEPGGHVAIRGLIIGPDGKRVPMTGTMATDEDGNSSGVIHFPNPKTGEQLTMRIVQAGSMMYMSSGLFGPLPGGAKWMALDLSSAGASAAPVSTGDSAEEGLQLLKGIDNVEKVGREDVRGTPTTRYRGTTGPNDLRVEAWIDGDGRILRMSLGGSTSGAADKGSPQVRTTTEFLDFDRVPPVKVPDSSEVFDATSLGEG